MNKDDQGKLNGVFIAAKKIKNNGVITSEGKETFTHIITDEYEGNREISSKNSVKEPCGTIKWNRNPTVIAAIISAIAIIISAIIALYN